MTRAKNMNTLRTKHINKAIELLWGLGAQKAIKIAIMDWHSRGYLTDEKVEELFKQYKLAYK